MFNITSEQDLKLQVKDKFFSEYKVSVEDKRIDFLVSAAEDNLFKNVFLWAESKKENTPINTMFAQLLLTIKRKIDGGDFPPRYLAVFDREKIAFIEFHHILPIFNLNDFNWSETPSSVSKKTENTVVKYLDNSFQFNFERDEKELKEFISKNFNETSLNTTKAQINKNNFVIVYNKWTKEVLPSIHANFNELKKYGIMDCDFFLADLLSANNKTIIEKLNIVLNISRYEIKKDINLFNTVDFTDKGTAHAKFWARYERPPKEEYHEYILSRRDLLVPQNIRERKGAYFTPAIWVEKSQEYLAKAFGENWQDEYYIWDCCAGTCNLLAGLTNKYNIWASTLDQPDVDIVHQSIENNELNLLKSHVFQFDFLNDDFSKLPQGLQDIINDPEKQKKLIIYINPPYAENGAGGGKGAGKAGVSNENRTYYKYTKNLGKASRELFAQFFVRVANELNCAKLSSFSKLKYINAPNFIKFRNIFKGEYLGGFVCPADTFDNVDGNFPIGFLIWDFKQADEIKATVCDVYDRHGNLIGNKCFYPNDGQQFINDWIFQHKCSGKRIGTLFFNSNDFQHQQYTYISLLEEAKSISAFPINLENIIYCSIYFTARHCIKADWLNDRDQFLSPSEEFMGSPTFEKDTEFQNNSLIFTLFHNQNRICSKEGINHWIPFTPKEVNAKDNFRSSFMSDFIKDRVLTPQAQAVFEAGKAFWTYYHQTIQSDDNALVNASLYEIREYFKGRDDNGRMNTKSTDEKFTLLDQTLKDALKQLAKEIQPKVYEYGFLKE